MKRQRHIGTALLVLTFASCAYAQWRPCNISSGARIHQLAATDTYLFAADIYSGIQRSSDRGVTWEPANTGLPNHTLFELYVSPDSSHRYVFAGTDGGGAYRTSDQGTSWQHVSAGLGDTLVRSFTYIGNVLFAGTSTGIGWSTDDGDSWTRITMFFGMYIGNVYALDRLGDTLLAATDNGLYCTADTGKTWYIMHSWPAKYIAVDGNSIYVPTEQELVLAVSHDRGKSWDFFMPQCPSWLIDDIYSAGGVLYAIGADEGPIRSTDSARTWILINDGLPTGLIHTLRIWNDTLYASAWPYGLWYRPLNEVLPVTLTDFSAVAGGTTVHVTWKTQTEVNCAGFALERRFLSTSYPQNTQWNLVGFFKGAGTSQAPRSYDCADRDLPPGCYAYRLKQVDNDGTIAYYGNAEAEVVNPAGFRLDQNRPNPFNPSTSISFIVPYSSYVTLKVYDLLGREIASIFDGVLDAGGHSFGFNGERLAGGVYYYRLQSETFVESKRFVLLK